MADEHSPVDVEKEKQEKQEKPALHLESQSRRDSSALAVLQLISTHDDAHPIHWPLWKKWSIIS